MKAKVLVTGGAGFIGSHLADRLVAEGYRAVVLDNESTGSRDNVPPSAEYVRGDITDLGDLDLVFNRGVEMVFHVAGQASIFQSFEKPEHDLKVNLVGTMNVVQKCLEYRVPRLLYASSMMVYGNQTTKRFSESDPCVPSSYYGISKYAAERYVHATAERNDLDFKFSVTSFRMFNVYGERQSLTNPYQGVPAIFIGRLLREEPLPIHSDGEQVRDFVYITDVVEAWMSAIDSPAAEGQVINLGTGAPRSINELADVALAAVGRSRRDYPVRYGAERVGDQRAVVADIHRARELLKWQPRVDFPTGLAATLHWARENASSIQRVYEDG